VEKFGTAGEATDDNVIRSMSFACWIPKATNTHKEYVIIIVLPLRNWVQEHGTILHYIVHFMSCYNRGGGYLFRGAH